MADIIQLITGRPSGYCGMSFYGNPPKENLMTAVSREDCATGHYTFGKTSDFCSFTPTLKEVACIRALSVHLTNTDLHLPDQSLGHEIGHLLGCQHAKGDYGNTTHNNHCGSEATQYGCGVTQMLTLSP